MSLISFGSMAFSGYLLQVVTSPAWIEVLVVIHIATSLVFAVGYMVHLVIGWRMSSATRAAVTEQVPDTARLLS
jgi:cytochrome b subunit of formate dehydrogenase